MNSKLFLLGFGMLLSVSAGAGVLFDRLPDRSARVFVTKCVDYYLPIAQLPAAVADFKKFKEQLNEEQGRNVISKLEVSCYTEFDKQGRAYMLTLD